MRILVVSDTHHDVFALRTAILRQPKAEVVVHLGDGEEEAARRADNRKRHPLFAKRVALPCNELSNGPRSGT